MLLAGYTFTVTQSLYESSVYSKVLKMLLQIYSFYLKIQPDRAYRLHYTCVIFHLFIVKKFMQFLCGKFWMYVMKNANVTIVWTLEVMFPNFQVVEL
jgi:hypothetical protein